MGRRGASALALALAALLAGGPASARKLYSYVDEQGLLHYTDRPPDTAQPVEVRTLRVDPSPMITVRQEPRDGGFRVWVANRWHGPVQVRISADLAENIHTRPALPADLVIDGAGEAEVLAVENLDATRPGRFRLAYAAVPGDPDARPGSFRYRPPFAPGSRYRVAQAFGGDATHGHPQSFHAVDLAMPEGTPVLAARGGIVMHAEEDFSGSGLDDRHAQRANQVRVLHDDGTMAVYAHLELESVGVRRGQRVSAGDELGRSGSTGYASGPHLHFAVQRNAGMRLETVPFAFDDGSPSGQIPRAGSWVGHVRRR